MKRANAKNMTEKDEERNFMCSSRSDFLDCYGHAIGEQWFRCEDEEAANFTKSALEAYEEYKTNCEASLDVAQVPSACGFRYFPGWLESFEVNISSRCVEHDLLFVEA